MVKALVSLGADPTATSPDGCTVLHHAVRSDLGPLPKLEYLLNTRGDGWQGGDRIDVAARNKDGETVDIAVRLLKADATTLLASKV